jgi:hypothetical protein
VYSKASVIDALRAVGVRVSAFISDEKLVEKINGLSDEDEEKLRAELESVLLVNPVELYFTSAANSTGKTITAETDETLTATSDQTWATATVSGNVVTVKVTANGAGAARKANVALVAGSKQVVVTVTQAA